MSNQVNVSLSAQVAASFSWNINVDRFVPIRLFCTATAFFAGVLGLYKVEIAEANGYLRQHGNTTTLAGQFLFKTLHSRQITTAPVAPVVHQPNHQVNKPQDGAVSTNSGNAPETRKRPLNHDPAIELEQRKPERIEHPTITADSARQDKKSLPTSAPINAPQPDKPTQPDSGARKDLPQKIKKNAVFPTTIRPLPAVHDLRHKIAELLDGIDTEIDNITIPDYLENHDKLRESVKSRFALYRTQLQNYINPTAKQLHDDLTLLQTMQKTMSAALRSPNTLTEELPFKGIVNPGLQCSYISQIQCQIHNQFFVFYVMAFGLLRQQSLTLKNPDSPAKEELDKANRWYKFYQQHLSSDTTTPTSLPYPNVKGKELDNSFPQSLFNIPVELSANPYGVYYDEAFQKLKAPGADIAFTVDKVNPSPVGGHHWALVRRKDGSITELNDRIVQDNRFKNLDKLIADFKTYQAKGGYHPTLHCYSSFAMIDQERKNKAKANAALMAKA
ncbi:hypothetical protein [Endozoicomonas ascidiicola]|uniref:hypothetical protein n=1 Tax=Endozoicomonas ascidiicola TaxID=1698521 RepID=UPI00082C2D88|nr:hypothetical protein [Endozoicomonas ascidiicola]